MSGQVDLSGVWYVNVTDEIYVRLVIDTGGRCVVCIYENGFIVRRSSRRMYGTVYVRERPTQKG